MDLDGLNKCVTNAILRAERLELRSWEAQRAFREVADLEEEIATLAGAQSLEGEIARLGAVTAALSSGEPLRALQLGERYRSEALSDATRAKLDELLREAESEIADAAATAPDAAQGDRHP